MFSSLLNVIIFSTVNCLFVDIAIQYYIQIMVVLFNRSANNVILSGKIIFVIYNVFSERISATLFFLHKTVCVHILDILLHKICIYTEIFIVSPNVDRPYPFSTNLWYPINILYIHQMYLFNFLLSFSFRFICCYYCFFFFF